MFRHQVLSEWSSATRPRLPRASLHLARLVQPKPLKRRISEGVFMEQVRHGFNNLPDAQIQLFWRHSHGRTIRLSNAPHRTWAVGEYEGELPSSFRTGI